MISGRTKPGEPLRLTVGEDLVFEFEGLPAGLEESIARRFEHFLDRPDTATQESLHISASPPPTGAAEPVSLVVSRSPLTVKRQGRQLLYEVQEMSGWCDPESGRAGIQIGSADQTAIEAFATMAVPSMLFELAGERGWLGIHAAAVAVGGHGILLPGPSGVGKTTLFEQAHRSGFQVLSDDLVWLQERPDGRFRLWACPAAGSERLEIPPTLEVVPLSAIVCPTIVARRASHLEPLALPSLLEALLPQTSFLTGGSGVGDRFRRLARAAGSVPGYRLEAAADPRRTMELLRQVIEDR